MRRTLLFASLALLPAFSANAAESRDMHAPTTAQMATEARVALVIGNGSYTSGPLKNPPNDAKAMAAALEKLGFKVTLRTNLDYRSMMTEVIEFGQALKSGGVGLFYYAGHGIQADGRNYLVPVDAKIPGEPYVKAQAIDLNTVLAGMEDAHNRLNIMVLDSCRNNPFERSFRSSSAGLAMVDAPSGTLIAYATSPGKVAEDGAGTHSSYTAALLRRLPTPGAKVEEVFKSVREDVRQATGGKQTPWENTSLTGDFYFGLPGTGGAAAVGPRLPAAPVTGSGSAGSDQAFERMVACNAELQAQEGKLRAQATSEWARVKPLTVKKNAATRKMVEAYHQKWGPGKAVARACEDALTLNVAEAREAQAWLSSYREDTGGATDTGGVVRSGGKAGIEWVEIPGKNYEMSRTEVTVAQYAACVNAGTCSNPDIGTYCTWGVNGKEDNPINCVDWNQATTFAQWAGGRLPTEEEWEYAAKGGEEFEYSGSSTLEEVAWYSKNSEMTTSPVGKKKANGYGLHDMSGNVWEWTATDSGSDRVLRGGSWVNTARHALVANRDFSAPGDHRDSLGFRLSRSGP